MNLRRKEYPPNFWLQLHTHTIDSPTHYQRKSYRQPTKRRLNNCITFLSPHIQKFVYDGAIDKRKGEIRATKFPLSSAQFNTIIDLGVNFTYQQVVSLEQRLNLKYNFLHKGYNRGIKNIQFRVQTQRPAFDGSSVIYLLRSQRQNVLEITTATEDAHLQAVASICKVNAVNIIEANEKKIFHITFDVAADCQSMKKIMQHAPNLAFV
ncbi:unnamed protein product [Rotaria socialis]